MNFATAHSVYSFMRVLFGIALLFPSFVFADLPFEFFRNEILVEFHIGDKGPYIAMIDTGTDPSTVDIKLANELGLAKGPGGEIEGGGTAIVKAYEVQLNDVRLGAVTVKRLDALAGESVLMIAKKLGRPVRAVFGKSFLNGRITQIDYVNKVLRFPTSVPPKTTGERIELRFQYNDDLVLEGVSLNDQPVRAILDTGSNGSIKITPEAVQRLNLQAEMKVARPSQSTGYRGSYTSYDGNVSSLSLGAFRVEHPAATFWTPGTGHDGKPWDVNIGNAIMKDFVITLDAINNVLYIDRMNPMLH